MTDLLDWTPPPGDRHGGTYVRRFDYARLNAQQARVFDAISDGQWRTLREISAATGDPEASISARLRDFRKPDFGGLDIERRRRGTDAEGLHEYRIKGDGK